MLRLLLELLKRAFLLSFFILSIMPSCNDDDNGNGLNGYYTELSYLPTRSDFFEIENAINNNELLSSYKYGGQTHNYYATKDLFINSDGSYTDSNAHFGRLRFSVNSVINVIKIVDNKTLLFYVGWLYEDGASYEDVVYRFYAGSIFGNMAFYGTPTYYSYIISNNKLVVSNGDIYTIVDGGLVKDGSSSRWSKYDPNKTY